MKYSLLIGIILISTCLCAQETASFRIHQIGTELGFYKGRSADNWGFQSSIITSFKQRKNIYELNLSAGIRGDLGKLEGAFIEQLSKTFLPKFFVTSLYYGREIPIVNKIKAVTLGGVSYLYATNPDKSAIGLPLKIRFEYKTKETLSFGLSSNYLINAIDNKLSFNFFVGVRLH